MLTPEQIAALLDGDCSDCTLELTDRDFRYLVLNSLQNLYDAIVAGGGGGGGAVALTPITQASITDAAISPAFQVVLTDAHNKKYISIVNYMDAPLLYSLDGTNINGIVGANGGSATLNLTSDGGYHPGNVSLKYLTAPSVAGASAYISAFY